jgi:hypothetical protein
MLRRHAQSLRIGAAGILLVSLSAAPPAEASAPPEPAAASQSAPQSARPRGRPDVKLDRLDFPSDVAGAKFFKQRLRKMLAREAKRADWGAGRGSRIEYRFSVTELGIEHDGDVLRVRCAAVGKLPGGKSAKSQLSFGGEPGQRNKIVERVLEIVARGVITRLAELERVRRGELEKSGVRPPSMD